MAIMGPRYERRCIIANKLLMLYSGCGKTTLLNVLAQRNVGASSVDKTILVNSQPTTWSQFRHLSSYVEQEDSLLGALTVKETLSFVAKLSLPS
jgi:ABC-type multidrug transport system ATPase subunit